MFSSFQQPVDRVVYLLVILFGVASWVDINGVWVELPILVQALPEGWSLPSYMVLLTQCANIAPLIYTIVSVRCPRRLMEKVVIYIIIGVGVSACVLLVFVWNKTSVIGGTPRSLALLTLQFFLSFVDTTSSVVFLPFMVVFKPVYMTAYFIGEGLSGLFPALLGLAQGAGRVVCVNQTLYNTVIHSHRLYNNVTLNHTLDTNVTFNYTEKYNEIIETKYNYVLNNDTTHPHNSITPTYVDLKFSIEVFYIIIATMVAISGLSFTLLNYHPRCKKQYHYKPVEEHNREVEEKSKRKKSELLTQQNGSVSVSVSVNLMTTSPSSRPMLTKEEEEEDKDKTYDDISPDFRNSDKMTRTSYCTSLVLTGWLCALTNAGLLSVQSFSCLPYGNTAFHLAVTLSNVANPLASFLALFVYVTSVPALCGLSGIGTLLGAYIMTAAAMSPYPFLVGTKAGGTIMVCVWVSAMFLMTYVKVCLGSLFRREGKRGLLYYGAVMQFGSLVVGVIMFFLVNVLNIFVMIETCT